MARKSNPADPANQVATPEQPAAEAAPGKDAGKNEAPTDTEIQANHESDATHAAGGDGAATGGESASPPVAHDAQDETAKPGAPADGGESATTAPEFDGDPALVVRGPKKGRRRAGFAFSAEPTILSRADLGEGEEARQRFIAILIDPRLSCAWLVDGEEHAIAVDDIAELSRLAEAGADLDQALAAASAETD